MIGTLLIIGAFLGAISLPFFRRRARLSMAVSLVVSIMLALAGIVFDSIFIKIIGAYGIIMDLRTISHYAEAKEGTSERPPLGL